MDKPLTIRMVLRGLGAALTLALFALASYHWTNANPFGL